MLEGFGAIAWYHMAFFASPLTLLPLLCMRCPNPLFYFCSCRAVLFCLCCSALEKVSLISSRDGVVKAIQGLERLRALPSYFGEYLVVKPGDRLCRTTNLFNSPGAFMLAHAERSQLERDAAVIRSMEENYEGGGLFTLVDSVSHDRGDLFISFVE